MILLENDYNLTLSEICNKYGVSIHKAQSMRWKAGIFRYFNPCNYTRDELLESLVILSKQDFMEKYRIQSVEYSSVLSFYNIRKFDIIGRDLELDIIRVIDLIGKEAFNRITYEKFGKYTYGAIKSHYGSMSALYDVFDIKKDSFQNNFLSYFEKVSNIKLQREVCFESCINPETGKKLRFDGYSENPPFLIEVDDLSHKIPFSQFGGEEALIKRVKRDSIKDAWAKENNIKLFRFSSSDNWRKQVLDLLSDINALPVEITSIKPTNSKYIGVSKLNNKWNVRVFYNGVMVHLGSYDSDLYGAILREKFLIIKNDVHAKRNNISIDDLKLCGFTSWDDVPLVNIKTINDSPLENISKVCKEITNKGVKKNYIGLKRLGNSFSAVVNVNGKSIQLGVFKSDKQAALFREGYIIEHNLKLRKNGFSLNDLHDFGIYTWEDYILLKRKKMCGLYYSSYYNVWGFKVVLNTYFVGQYSVLGFESELSAAVYRERLLQVAVVDGKEKFNYITKTELKSLGFNSWEDVPIYNLNKRSFIGEVPYYTKIGYKNQYFNSK